MLELRAFAPRDFAALRSWAPTADDVRLFAGSAELWPLTDETLAGWATAPDATAWTAELDGVAAGHIELVRTGPAIGRLARVLLDPALRGRGLGRALAAAAVEAATAAGVTTLDLNVITGNLAAERTYRSLGFRPLGPNPEHPDMTRMRRDRPSA